MWWSTVPMNIPFESGDVVKVDYGIRCDISQIAATTIIIENQKSPPRPLYRGGKRSPREWYSSGKSRKFRRRYQLILRRPSHKVDFILFVSSPVMVSGHRFTKPDIYNFWRPGKGRETHGHVCCNWAPLWASRLGISLILVNMLSVWKTAISVSKKNIVVLSEKRDLRLLFSWQY